MKSYVYRLADAWGACWRGQVASATFNSRGAALAYLASCDAVGKLRA